jgi:hypothetical protein
MAKPSAHSRVTWGACGSGCVSGKDVTETSLKTSVLSWMLSPLQGMRSYQRWAGLIRQDCSSTGAWQAQWRRQCACHHVAGKCHCANCSWARYCSHWTVPVANQFAVLIRCMQLADENKHHHAGPLIQSMSIADQDRGHCLMSCTSAGVSRSCAMLRSSGRSTAQTACELLEEPRDCVARKERRGGLSR